MGRGEQTDRDPEETEAEELIRMAVRPPEPDEFAEEEPESEIQWVVLLQEVFLALYNEYRIVQDLRKVLENHEGALQRIEQAILSGKIRIVHTEKGTTAAETSVGIPGHQPDLPASQVVETRSMSVWWLAGAIMIVILFFVTLLFTRGN